MPAYVWVQGNSAVMTSSAGTSGTAHAHGLLLQPGTRLVVDGGTQVGGKLVYHVTVADPAHYPKSSQHGYLPATSVSRLKH